MRLSIPLFLLLSIFNVARAKPLPDTLTYWQVYLKGYLIKSFNENQSNPTLTITLKDLTLEERLLVRYFRDTPCASCPTHLLIYDDQKNEVLMINGKGTFSSLTFPIKKLIDKWKTDSPKYFEAYYWENNSTRHKLLFILKFE